MTARVSVLIVDTGGSGASEALGRDAELDVRVVSTFEAALVALGTFRPAVLVVAFATPTAADAEALGRVTRATRAPLLVVSRPAEPPFIERLLKAGAHGYVFSEEAPPYLPLAVKQLARSTRAPPCARTRRCGTRSTTACPGPAPEKPLSRRQCEVLTLLAGGHSYEHIALALGLSLNTVRSHIRAIYERLEVNTKVEAAVLAAHIGLL